QNDATGIDAFPMGSSIGPQNNSPGLAQSIWSAWSAQALMLGYLEQGPLYNACNFSWAVLDGSNFSGSANVAADSNYNQTVLYTNLSMFMCPSDPNVGQKQNNNSYAASYGATTTGLYNWTFWPPGGSLCGETGADSTGIFTIGKSYGIQNITDGSSNTVAYSEALVGDSNGSEFAGNTTNPSRYRGNYITGAVTPAKGAEKMLNAQANPTLIFTSLAECVA